jgi:hypothetical protein
MRNAFRCGAGETQRRRPHPLSAVICLLLIVSGASARSAVPVEFIGEYSNVAADREGYPYGFTVTLWRYGNEHLGVVAYFAGAEGHSHTSVLRDVAVTEGTGALSFRAKLMLGERRSDAGDWGREIEGVEFVGTVGEDAVVGDFIADRGAREAPFESRSVVLPRRPPEAWARSYGSYAEWLASVEPALGTREIVGAAPVGEPWSHSLHVGLSGGVVRTMGDGAKYFNTTGVHTALDVFYTVASRLSFGVRVGAARWNPNQLRVQEDVAPDGVELVSLDVPETGYLLEFSPGVRVSAGNAASERLVAFAQLSAGVYYVNLESPYALGPHLRVVPSRDLPRVPRRVRRRRRPRILRPRSGVPGRVPARLTRDSLLTAGVRSATVIAPRSTF